MVAELDRLDTWSETTGEQTKAIITIFERAMDAARRVGLTQLTFAAQNGRGGRP